MQLSQLMGSTSEAQVSGLNSGPNSGSNSGSNSGGGAADVRGLDITGLALDSRSVRPGYLFAALPGAIVDGRDFVPEALERGASAILTGPEPLDTGDAALVLDPNPRRAFSLMAAAFYGAQPATVAAVTGTNGKTSVAGFTRQLWQALGQKAASIGTLGVEGDGPHTESGLTTPDPLSLHKALADIAAAGVDHAVVEASSHGLSQYRLDGVDISVAAFTNLTRDHLDYHETAEDYLAAKTRLFADVLKKGGKAVVNLASEYGAQIASAAERAGHEVLSVGQSGDATLAWSGLANTETGQRTSVTYGGQNYEVMIPLLGAFQMENALLAAGILLASGQDAAEVFAALANLKGVAGRFELAGRTKAGARVFVDYAHTPDGLENILGAARTISSGRLLVVFGCGGDRDAGKRPQMGEIAARLADRVFVTDDNPRNEDPAAIRREILAAAPDSAEFDSRSEAIRAAITEAGADDIVLVVGKGHETGQDFGGTVVPYDDFSTVEAAVNLADQARSGGAEEAGNAV